MSRPCLGRRTATGFTLIETMVVITLGSSLMCLAIGAVHQTMRLSSVSRENAFRAQTQQRFLAQFRKDIHLAEKVESVSEQNLKCYLNAGVVLNYQSTSEFVTRELTLANGTTTNETLELPDGRAIKFSILADPDRATLTLERVSELTGVVPHIERRVEAVVGRQLVGQQLKGRQP